MGIDNSNFSGAVEITKSNNYSLILVINNFFKSRHMFLVIAIIKDVKMTCLEVFIFENVLQIEKLLFTLVNLQRMTLINIKISRILEKHSTINKNLFYRIRSVDR